MSLNKNACCGVNQLAKVTDALKHVTRYTYDQTGSLLIQNVGDGQTVESSYNDIGMVTEVSGAEGSITTESWTEYM